MTAVLEARDLTVSFGAHTVLDGLDLTVAAGSFVVLLGASGCGKSTLLNAFAGLQRPASGATYAHGVPITAPDRSRGVAFQRDILFPWTNVRGNLDFALSAARVPKDERARRSDELLAAVALPTSVLALRPHECSGGMRQRVGLARMLAARPDVMLLDEPFAALDAQTRLNMQDLVTDLWTQQKATVIFVTHDVDEAIRLGDRLVVLRHGRVHADIDNPLERPRPAASLAELAGYALLRRHLHNQLATPVRTFP